MALHHFIRLDPHRTGPLAGEPASLPRGRGRGGRARGSAQWDAAMRQGRRGAALPAPVVATAGPRPKHPRPPPTAHPPPPPAPRRAGQDVEKHIRTALCDKDPGVMAAALCALQVPGGGGGGEGGAGHAGGGAPRALGCRRWARRARAWRLPR
jgi:hypothetical protein